MGTPALGETVVPGLRGGKGACLSCGAQDDHLMIRKHRKGCPYISFFAAIHALKEMLDGKPKTRRRKKQ